MHSRIDWSNGTLKTQSKLVESYSQLLFGNIFLKYLQHILGWPFGPWPFGPLALWSLPFGPWPFGPLALLSIGPLAPRPFGPLALWPLALWPLVPGPLVRFGLAGQ